MTRITIDILPGPHHEAMLSDLLTFLVQLGGPVEGILINNLPDQRSEPTTHYPDPSMPPKKTPGKQP